MENMLLNILILAMMFSLSYSDSSSDKAQTAADRAKKIQRSMYSILRTMALPDASIAEGALVTQRFVLQVPGKQLNPQDYDPTNYTQDAATNRLSSFIPPVIEENMFRLTDVVPVANPMQGGETGESFLEMYETVLNQLDVRGFKKKTQENQQRYKQAIEYLSKPIPDPDDLTKNTTRLGMYVRLQKRYNDVRLDMENKIKQERDRHEDDQVKFQTWFQTNYPPLYANVENAYTEWLVFGEKDLVEMYKAHLDVESQGVIVEEARTALRSGGKASLDRTSTIYPVHFEPSNWYEYLKAKPQPLSKEQVQIKLGDIEAQLAVLKNMKEQKPSEEAKKKINSIKAARDNAKTELKSQTSELSVQKVTCIFTQSCEKYRSQQEKLTKLSTDYSRLKAQVEYAEFELSATDESKESLQKLISNLEAQQSHYTSLLDSAKNEITDVQKASSDDDTQDFKAGWMQFEFDSSSVSKSIDKSSTSYAASLEVNVGGFGWGVSGGASYSKDEQNFAQKMSQADMKISAKILKVTIKRSWFKSSLFKLKDIMMRTEQKVSPGPMTEPELIKDLQKKDSYLLPQFVNAILLAKDVTLEFKGVDSEVTSHAMKQSANGHLSGNYGPFSASTSFNYGSSESNLGVQSTTDGLRISIPGAQLIGYYVTVLPCFPKSTCKENK